jgi:acylphosphatase
MEDRGSKIEVDRVIWERVSRIDGQELPEPRSSILDLLSSISGAMSVCKRVNYSGRVQGVGFRYTALHLAASFPIAGYVRNLPNGNVELVAEGAAEDVDAFLSRLAEQMAGYIEETVVTEEEPGGLQGFRIKY